MNTKHDIIDATLKLMKIEGVNRKVEVESNQLENILEANYSVSLDDVKKEQIITKLKNEYSFGQLLNAKMSENQKTSIELAKEIKFPKLQLLQLVEDKVYANNVPVKKIKQLIVALNISFENAEKAIRKSFDMIVQNQKSNHWRRSTQLSYRRNARSSGTNNSYSSQKSGIYENEQALEKYLEHLKQLM